MAYVMVTVIAPNGREYDAEVDESASDQALLSNLVEMLGLPSRMEDGRTVEYRLTLIGATRIRRGVTMKIERVELPTILSIRPRQ